MRFTIAIPTMNQTALLIQNLEEHLVPYFDSLGIDYEILVCSDGSDEPNQKALEQVKARLPEKVRFLTYQGHSGKGHNVKRLIEEAESDWFVFMDTDLATDLDAFQTLLPYIDDYEAIIASRHHEGSLILGEQGFLRRLMGRVSRSLIRHKFKFKGITDTQCGFKAFKTSVAKKMAEKQIIDGFAFDVEYLYFLFLNDYRVLEIPCRWTDYPSSTIGHPFKSSRLFVKDLRKIQRNKKNYILTAEEKIELEELK